MNEFARLLFSLRQPVSQRAYILAGFGLMVLKYGVDAGAVHLATGEFWTPLDYLNPLFEDRGRPPARTVHEHARQKPGLFHLS